MNYPHLSPKAAEQLNLDDLARIEYIRSPRWIGYPQAQQILMKLEDLLVFPSRATQHHSRLLMVAARLSQQPNSGMAG